MPNEFIGDPTPLSQTDFEDAARELGCSVAAVKAVAFVESAGDGFFSDGRPKILYERHIFHRQTGGQFSAQHSDISWASGGGYIGGTREYDRLERAIALDREGALKSASWGKFQIMGFNHEVVGFPDVESFVAAMVSGEPAQLKAFCAFIKTNGLADELVRLDWEGFARGYNGPSFRRFKYHTKMADAYALYSGGGARTDNPTPLLRIGDRGQAVMHLQELLGIVTDGDFGPATKAAVVAFQQANDLYADGIVGQQTWAVLLAQRETEEPEPARARPPLRYGDEGEDVKYLQECLEITADGDFGPATKAAVIAFQQSKGLVADGIVGAKTWAALLD